MEFKGKYAFLSNFYPTRVWFEGLEFRSVEHAFQAAKIRGIGITPEMYAQINSSSAAEVKRLGRKVELRADWHSVREDIMLALLRQKFSGKKLRNLLNNTNNTPIVEENTWGDRFWGVCGGEGRNVLGKMLEGIRDRSLGTKVNTARVGSTAPDRLDITVKSGHKLFAPTWEMVLNLKSGLLTQEEYTKVYLSMMRKVFDVHHGELMEVVSRSSITLLCYCRTGDFCHRLLLADILEALGGQRGTRN